MTRKDYEAIASILRANRHAVEGFAKESLPIATALLDSIESDLIQLFESDNPRFSSDRFRSASKSVTQRNREVLDQIAEELASIKARG